jgi:hypothetical protein
VNNAAIGPIKITLAVPVRISGKVVDASGKAVSGVLIYLVSGTSSGSASSDADGAFQTFLRVAGDYKVYLMQDQNRANDPGFADFLKAHANDYPLWRVVAGENPPLMLRWTGQ